MPVSLIVTMAMPMPVPMAVFVSMAVPMPVVGQLVLVRVRGVPVRVGVVVPLCHLSDSFRADGFMQELLGRDPGYPRICSHTQMLRQRHRVVQTVNC